MQHCWMMSQPTSALFVSPVTSRAIAGERLTVVTRTTGIRRRILDRKPVAVDERSKAFALLALVLAVNELVMANVFILARVLALLRLVHACFKGSQTRSSLRQVPLRLTGLTLVVSPPAVGEKRLGLVALVSTLPAHDVA